MRKQYTLLAICMLMIGVLLPASAARAQSGGWQQPIQLSETGRFSWFPDVTTDASGRVHIVWSSAESRYDNVMYTTRLDAAGGSDSWSRPVDVAAFRQGDLGESAATRPGIVVDKLGNLHLTYTDYGEIFHSKVFQDIAVSPQAWSEPQTVNTETSTYFSRVAVDSRSALHLVYTQNVLTEDCRICFHLYYRSSSDGGDTWSAPTDISLAQVGSAKPQIMVDRNDNVHVVWESGPSGGTLGAVREPTKALYSASYDGGKSWTAPYEFTTGALGAQGKNPAIAEDGEGGIVVIWRGAPEQAVYSQVSRDAGRTWSASQRIAGVFTTSPIYGGGLDIYSAATDGAGNVHLVMAGRLDQDQEVLSVLHLTWNGSSWSEPTPIFTYANGDVPEWPRIAVGLGNQLHATWFTRDKANAFGSDSGTADYRVWYSRVVDDAPAIAPVVYPTLQPTAQPTAAVSVAAVQPTPVAVSTSSPQTSNAALRTEMDEVAVILVSVLPVVGIMAVALLLLRRRG
jgi:hypothetical protein